MRLHVSRLFVLAGLPAALVVLCTAAAGQDKPAVGDPTVRIEADCARIGMGRSVEIRVAATWADGRPAAGHLLLPYVNGKRWGAHEYADAQGRATMLLPLPNPGLDEIQVEATGALGICALFAAVLPIATDRPRGHLVWVVPAAESWPAGTLARGC